MRKRAFSSLLYFCLWNVFWRRLVDFIFSAFCVRCKWDDYIEGTGWGLRFGAENIKVEAAGLVLTDTI